MKLGWIWVIGSIATLTVAYGLWKDNKKDEAMTLLYISPFPCPPGLPC